MSRLRITVILCMFFSKGSLLALPCLFAHGLVDTGAQAYRYAQNTLEEYSLFRDRPFTFDFLDAGTGWRKYYKVHRSSLAQQDEIDLLTNHCQQLSTTSDNGMLLMGVSRGASTIINFMAHKTPLTQKVKALILESPFDRAQNIMLAKVKKIPWGAFLAPFFLRLSFPKHNKNGIHPEDVVGDLPLNLPILLICSKEDTVIPSSSTMNLFTLLVESGHTEVYLLTTERGAHAKILWGPDGENYQLITQAFLAHYGLTTRDSSYNAALEKKEACLLEACKGVYKG